MKQFIRYLLLIACVMLVGVWGWSFSFYASYAHFQFLEIGNGEISFGYGVYVMIMQEGLCIENRHSGSLWNRLGLHLPSIHSIPDQDSLSITIPIWLLFTPLLLVTLKLWYHPIKNWRQGTDRQGFEVEMKEQSDKPA